MLSCVQPVKTWEIQTLDQLKSIDLVNQVQVEQGEIKKKKNTQGFRSEWGETGAQILSALQGADETPEGFLQTVPGRDVSAAPDNFDSDGSGELLCGALLLQPETQHEGAGGGSSCSGCWGATETLRLLQVRNSSYFLHVFI